MSVTVTPGSGIDESAGGVPSFQVNNPATVPVEVYNVENIVDGTYKRFIDLQDFPGGCTILVDITNGTSSVTVKLYLFAGPADTLDDSLNWKQDTTTYPDIIGSTPIPRWRVDFPLRGAMVEIVSSGGGNDADCIVDATKAEAA